MATGALGATVRAGVADAEAPSAVAPEDLGIAAREDLKVRSLTSDATVFTVASYVAQGMLFVAGLLQKGVMGPVLTGYWALMQTFWTFATVAPLGVYHGTGRQIPLHRGRGDYRGAAAVADTGGSFSVVAVAVAGTFLVATALLFGAGWAPEMRWGLVILGASAPLRTLTDYHEDLFTNVKQFRAVSVTAVWKAVLALTVQTLLVVWLGFYGMFAGVLIAEVSLFVLWRRLGLISLRRPAFHFRVERGRLRELMSYGLPIMIHGQIWLLFLAIDNLIVANYLDVRRLGYYALAVSITSYVLYLPRSIGAAIFPRMTEQFARSEKIESIRRYAVDTQRLLAYTLIPLFMGCAFYGMPVLIREGLTSFSPAIGIVRIMVAASFFIALVNMPIKILITAGYRWRVTGLMALCLVFNAAANYVAVAVLDLGLKGAAWATALSYFVAFVVMSGYSLGRSLPWREAFAHIAELIAVFLYATGALWGIEVLLGSGAGSVASDIGLAIAKTVLFTATLIPWFILAERRYGALTQLGAVARRAGAKLGWGRA